MSSATSTERSAAEAEQAPDPDAEVKADSPAELSKPSWIFVLRKTVREFSRDQCTDLAAGLTYYAVLALFPAAIALLALVGLFGKGPKTVTTLLDILTRIGAGSAVTTLKEPLLAIANAPGAAGIAFVIGLVSALLSASGYVGAFGRAMNKMYDIGEGRPFWKLRPTMLLVTLIAVLLAALVALALVVSGPIAQAVGDTIGLGSTAVFVWGIAKWPVMLLVVVLIVAILYYATPNIEQPRFRWISIGAGFAILAWIVASAAFGVYLATFASYNKTYGSMAGIVVFLLWLWITNLALLFGAELDSEIERGRQLQAGLAAEETLQLPPRGTSGLIKAEEKQREDIERGRALRLSLGREGDPDELDVDTSVEPEVSGDPTSGQQPRSTTPLRAPRPAPSSAPPSVVVLGVGAALGALAAGVLRRTPKG